MATWTNLTFGFGSLLTSTKMTQLDENLDAMAEGSAGAPEILPSAIQNGEDILVKAWVNFDGTGVVAINDSFNVIGITDNGVGDYDINFDTAFATANYVWSGGAEDTNTNGDAMVGRENGATKSTTAMNIFVIDNANNKIDSPDINVMFIGGQ